MASMFATIRWKRARVKELVPACAEAPLERHVLQVELQHAERSLQNDCAISKIADTSSS